MTVINSHILIMLAIYSVLGNEECNDKNKKKDIFGYCSINKCTEEFTGYCKCNSGIPMTNTKIGQFCAPDCGHGTFDYDKNMCICESGWIHSGITDFGNFIMKKCEQSTCESDKQCQTDLGIVHATCPIKKMNCDCGLYYSFHNFGTGYETDKGSCSSLPFQLFHSLQDAYIYMTNGVSKYFLIAALICLPFGTRRVRCTHYRNSVFLIIRKILGFTPSCRGRCTSFDNYDTQTFSLLLDDFAWSYYCIELLGWYYVAVLSTWIILTFIIGMLWFTIYFTIVAIILIVMAIIGCLMALGSCGGGGDCNPNCNCNNCCDVQFASGSGSADYTLTNYEMLWIYNGHMESPYLGDCDCCCNDCCFCKMYMDLLKLIVKILFLIPLPPDNILGGFIGLLFGTHLKFNWYREPSSFQDYNCYDNIIYLFSLKWTQCSDEQMNEDWREFVYNHIYSDFHSDLEIGQLPESENDDDCSVTTSKIGKTTIQVVSDKVFSTSDGCTLSTIEEYENGICLICQEENYDKGWDMWINCKHIFCSECSTKMIQRNIPCPLCRCVSTKICRSKCNA